jgi:hypothetical protein
MAVQADLAPRAATWAPVHPNEFDQQRIARLLDRRRRYRYVTPTVVPVSGGYRIESPCCSRNIDPDGGVIDIALLLYDGQRSQWRLFCRDHTRQSWELHSAYGRLHELLEGLNADVDRTFWQ